MKIIHILLGKANTNRMNGVNKVVDSLATYQTQLGYDVCVWGITKNPTHSYPKRIYHTELFKEKSLFFLPEGIENAIKKTCFDTIFHLHGGFIPQFILVAKLILRNNFNYVLTPHGSYNSVAMERSYWKKKIYCLLFESNLVRRAKAIHFIGKSEIDGAKKSFQLNEYKLIPNGQNIEEINIGFDLKKDNCIPIFGFCGRLDIKTKGLDILFKGFAKYLEVKGCKGELCIIGDGDGLEELKELAENLNILDHVKFLGSIYGIEKFKVLHQFDVLMLTSRNEGLPMVVLEAGVLGVPSIVSKATNMGDYIANNYSGITLEKNTPSHIANAMKTAIDWKINGEIERVGKNVQKMITKQFNWEIIAEKIIQIYA